MLLILTDLPDKPLKKTSRIKPLCPTRWLSRVPAVTWREVVHDLEPVVVPRARRPPQRYCGKSAVYVAATPEEHYRVAYYAVIDYAIVQLMERFNKESAGLQTY